MILALPPTLYISLYALDRLIWKFNKNVYSPHKDGFKKTFKAILHASAIALTVLFCIWYGLVLMPGFPVQFRYYLNRIGIPTLVSLFLLFIAISHKDNSDSQKSVVFRRFII